uniref:CMP/dCMP-type deaminase domain-containing protein n=1 Tax=Syphacia muris TaxID=451379 RepID=A0A0N5AP73_9BILA
MEEFMKKAVEEACAGVAAGDGGPFGAVVVKDGKIIAAGHNMVLKTNDCTAHAEITAIRNACAKLGTFDLHGCALYTSCYPCPMCMGACLWARFNGIYYATTAIDAARYGFDDKAFHDFLKDPKTDNIRKLEPLVVDGALKPFEDWGKKSDKVQY